MRVINVPVPSLDRTIYHEVGHLFVGRFLGIMYDNNIVAIRIKFGKEESVTFLNSEFKDKDSIEIILKKIIVTIAGKEIEKLKIGDVFEDGIEEDCKNKRNLEQIINEYWGKEINEDNLIQYCDSILLDNIDIIDELYCFVKKEILLDKSDIDIKEVESILNRHNKSKNNLKKILNILI